VTEKIAISNSNTTISAAGMSLSTSIIAKVTHDYKGVARGRARGAMPPIVD